MADGMAATQTERKVAVIWPSKVEIERDDIEARGWNYLGLGGGPILLFEKRINGRTAETMRWNAKTGIGEVTEVQE